MYRAMRETTEEPSAGTATDPRPPVERRRLWDRRAAAPRRAEAERRHGERRRATDGERADRRAGRDRRQAERRMAAERRGGSVRRRDPNRGSTPLPFSVAEAADLRTRFAAPSPVRCPACGGSFTLGPARHPGARTERLVLCTACGRAAVVHDTPAARVLVVSSIAPLRGLLRDMLVNGGHEVVEVDDAAVGLGACRVLPPDVVLLDVVGTGRIDPAQFLERLRADHASSRVVALAGRPDYAGVDPLQVVPGLGELATIQVPISREALLTVIQDVRA